MGDHLDNFTETIVRLQSEIAALKGDAESYRDQYQQEKQRRKDLQVRLNQSEHERRQMYDKMHVLMFEHLPAYSPKFNDIGRMDVSAEENDNMIGPYCIVSKIGKGCFGDVFRAVDSRSGRDEHYAIKCIKKTKFQRFKDVQQQAVEIHILKNYPHPNIIKLLDVVHGPENITVVMDLMQMDLHQYHDLMRRRSPAKQMSERDAKQVLFGILHPLAYLHSHGIAHLDIKPENILLDWNTVAGNLTHYNVRLSDFGLIKMADKPSTTRDVIRKAPCPVGTPGFFAPELVLGSKVECRIADMWSIGCVVMEITLGFTPEWMESYSAALSESSDFSDGIETELGLVRECEQLMENEELSQVINGLLHMDPSKRLTAEQTLAEPWLGEVLLVANQLAVKMSMEPTGSPSEPIQQETYDQRTHLVGPLPGYGHLVN
jgi:serine/threonine protein kinase/FtsZ-binding cell division protein ZapB